MSTKLIAWNNDWDSFFNWIEKNYRPIKGRYFISTQSRVATATMLNGLTEKLISALAASNIPEETASKFVKEFKKIIFYSSKLGPVINSPKDWSALVKLVNNYYALFKNSTDK
jgi:hypothetical protein